MSTATVQDKIRRIETELALVKRSLAREPDFSVDEQNWKAVEKTVRQIRAANFKRTYEKT